MDDELDAAWSATRASAGSAATLYAAGDAATWSAAGDAAWFAARSAGSDARDAAWKDILDIVKAKRRCYD